MNKSKIKHLMWWSVGSLAIVIFISVLTTQEIYIALLSVIFYCALPTLFTLLAVNELNKGDVKTIEEFDAQEQLNKHIKDVKKEKRQKWWEDNKKMVIKFLIILGIAIISLLIWISTWK